MLIKWILLVLYIVLYVVYHVIFMCAREYASTVETPFLGVHNGYLND